MNGQVCLIVNPTAGGGRAGRTISATESALEEHGLPRRTVVATDRDQVRELAGAAARAGETVVALGGDGMVGAAADGLRGTPGARLGIVPAGRGNDLARVLRIPRDPRRACAIVAHGAEHSFDLGEVDGRVFVGIASVGFDSEANRIANMAPAWLGSGVYAYGALRAMVGWRPANFRVELVGAEGDAARTPAGDPTAVAPVPSTMQFRGYSVALANSRCFGGGMRLAPSAMLDDGLLDVVAIERMARARYVLNLPRVFVGAHLSMRAVHHARVREAVVSADRPFTMYADGDPIGELPVRVRLLPAAINVLAPPGLPAFGAASATGPDATEPSARQPDAPQTVSPGASAFARPRTAPASR